MSDADLRDLFAGIAMHALLQSEVGRRLPTDVLADEAYAVASFMMAARAELHDHAA